MIDLMPFCSRDDARPYIERPYSRGEWTYATDGRILVRVPRIDDVPDNDKAPDAQKLFDQNTGGEHIKLPAFEIPKPGPAEECDECEGRGVDHECPDCKCTCSECHGTGEPVRGKRTSVGIDHVTFAGRYMLLLQALPNVELTLPPGPDVPSHFRFDGGEGLLMQMRGTMSEHIKAQISKAA